MAVFGLNSTILKVQASCLAAAAVVLSATMPPAWADGGGAQPATRQIPATYQGPSTPAIAPKGIRLAVIPCGVALSGCMLPAEAAVEAGKRLGWTARIFDGAANQQAQNAAILDAVSAGYNVIITVAIDPNFIQAPLVAAKRAGIPVFSISQGLDTPNPVVRPQPGSLGYALDVGIEFGTMGQEVGRWIEADSGGKANVVVYADEEYVSANLSAAGVLKVLRSCSGCTVQPVQQFTASQITTTLGQQVIGFLRSHPDVDYIYVPYDPGATPMVDAIAEAGMGHRVKLTSFVGYALNLNFIRQGRVQVADGCQESDYLGYAAVDQAIRILNKQPLFEPHGENTPFTLVDKHDLPPPGKDWHANFEFKSKFLSLWK